MRGETVSDRSCRTSSSSGYAMRTTPRRETATSSVPTGESVVAYRTSTRPASSARWASRAEARSALSSVPAVASRRMRARRRASFSFSFASGVDGMLAPRSLAELLQPLIHVGTGGLLAGSHCVGNVGVRHVEYEAVRHRGSLLRGEGTNGFPQRVGLGRSFRLAGHSVFRISNLQRHSASRPGPVDYSDRVVRHHTW